jgi:hypothetical protein
MTATVQLSGVMLIGAEAVTGGNGVVHAVDPATGAQPEPGFGLGAARRSIARPSRRRRRSTSTGRRRRSSVPRSSSGSPTTSTGLPAPLQDANPWQQVRRIDDTIEGR